MLLGDSMDCARTHFRKHIRSYQEDGNSQAQLDKWMRQDVRDLAKVLKPIKDRIVGVVRGNHYWTDLQGINSEQHLANDLEIPYLGSMAMVRVDFKDGDKTRQSITIWGHHHGGTRGSGSTSGDVMALERIAGGFEADIYAVGHTHRTVATKLPRITLTGGPNPQAVEHTRVFVRAGAFLKGFRPDNPNPISPHNPSYEEDAALRPIHMDQVRVDVRFKRVGRSGPLRKLMHVYH
jgi:predicted phosphodiesterase